MEDGEWLTNACSGLAGEWPLFVVQGNRSEVFIILDLVVQSVMLGLLVLLFLNLVWET
jgi:hypothetical protein